MRYESEISLRLYGDREEAQKYIAEARKVLGEVWNRDIVLGGIDQSWRRVQLSDSVFITVHASIYFAPIVAITAITEQVLDERQPQVLLLSAWYPEGLVFTPVSLAIPDGKGLPTRDPLTGDQLLAYTTTNPVFPQVLMNRFQKNKHLDTRGFVSGTKRAADGLAAVPELTRPNVDDDIQPATTEFRYWYKIPRPLDYGVNPQTYDGAAFWADDENQSPFPTIPGEYLVTEEIIDGKAIETAVLITEQKTQIDGTDLIQEPESVSWFSHRAEEILYPTPAHEAIFLRTNEYRAQLLGPPLHRHLRGDGNASAIAVAEVANSQDLAHNSANFRPGFRTAYGKMLNATGVDEDSGENLLIGPDVEGLSEAVGNLAADYWRNSAGHYANMISTRWDNDASPIPGAQHQIAYAVGTATEASEDRPDITDTNFPVSGGIWAQTFTKRAEWVKAWEHWYEGDYGLVGWEGTGQPQDNELITFASGEYKAYFGFRGCRYILPNSVDEDEMVRVLGVSVYNRVNELWFRVAILTNTIGDETLPSNERIYKDGSIKIFRAPVGVSEVSYRPNFGYYGDPVSRVWELEAEIALPFDPVGGEGWLYPAFCTAAISPDGRKMCFSYQKYRVDTQPLLHRSSDDFGVSTDREVLVSWIVHLEKEVNAAWVEHEKAPPTVTVSANNIQSGSNPINNYTRSLTTIYDYMPYYTDSGILQYVELIVNEYQAQQSSGRFWKVHKLRFGSGKEVLIQYQVLDNIRTPPDLAVFAGQNPLFPFALGETATFSSIIHYLDPKNEDIVYTKYYVRYEEAFPADLFGDLNYYDKQEMFVSVGDDSPVLVWSRDDYWATPYFVLDGEQIWLNSTGSNGTGPWSTGPELKLLRTPNAYSIYNYKAPNTRIFAFALAGPPPFGTNGLWQGSMRQSRVVYPFDQPAVDPSNPFNPPANVYDPNIYGLYDIEGMFNQTSYSASIWQPPIIGNGRMRYDNYLPRSLFSDQIDASLYTDNLAPKVSDSTFSAVKFVSYNGRWLLRGQFTDSPHKLYAEPSGFVDLVNPPNYTDFDLSPAPLPAESEGTYNRITGDENLSVLVAANFDLDAAAEIVDVTDISPFGRAV